MQDVYKCEKIQASPQTPRLQKDDNTTTTVDETQISWRNDATTCETVMTRLTAVIKKHMQTKKKPNSKPNNEDNLNNLVPPQSMMNKQTSIQNNAIFTNLKQHMKWYSMYKNNALLLCLQAMQQDARVKQASSSGEIQFQQLVTNALLHDVENQIVLNKHQWILDAFFMHKDDDEQEEEEEDDDEQEEQEEQEEEEEEQERKDDDEQEEQEEEQEEEAEQENIAHTDRLFKVNTYVVVLSEHAFFNVYCSNVESIVSSHHHQVVQTNNILIEKKAIEN